VAKKPFIVVLLVLLSLGLLIVGESSANDLGKELRRDLQECKIRILRAARKHQAGGGSDETVSLKSCAEKVRASHLLMTEHFRHAEDKASSLGAVAVERLSNVSGEYSTVLDEYLSLIDAIPSDGSPSIETLDALTKLTDKILPRKSPPLLGTLPYKHLSYPAREPATSSLVTPAYRGGNRDVTPADTAASTEAPISTEIADLAKSLRWNPVFIYEWVKNNVETEWYWGVMKGAEETLHQKSGNDADQAALLTALLRASGFPTRYVRGTIEFFPDIEKVKNLTGIDDPMQIADFFRKAGIAFKPVIAGGTIANFQIEHVWVESQIPYSNYRGAVIDDMGKSWLGLDTSIKPAGYTRNTPLDIPASVTDTVRDDYLQAVQDKTPLEFLQGRVGDYLNANQPGKGWQDVLASRTLNPDVLKIIPASLQFRQVAFTGEYAELPAELRHRMKFTATANASELFSVTVETQKLSNRKVVLTYEPETVEDQQIIDSFGGLDNTPSYLVHLRPALKLDGERLAVAQDGLPMGGDYTLAMDVIAPNGTERTESSHIAGNLAVIGIVAQRAIKPADMSAEEKDAERLLFEEALGYIDRWNRAEDELAASLKLAVARPLPTMVTVGGVIDVTNLLDMPHGFEWQGVFMDAALRRIETVTRTGDRTRETTFMRLSALQGSILENRVFEGDFLVDSISTAKLLQLAAGSGAPLLAINRANVDALLPTLPFDEAVKADIVNTVNQNLTVRIPQAEIAYQDWTGIGYVKENPETGESGWMLSGMIAGGMTALNKAKWREQDKAYKLRLPYSKSPNKDPGAVTELKRMTDYLSGTAGENVGRPLQVVALDAAKHPVQNVPVTFRVVAGGGTIQEVSGNGATIGAAGSEVTVTTEYDGIARVKHILGEHTADAPYYVHALPNSIMVGQNLVSASTPKGSVLLTLDKPMEALGYPGDTVDLIKVAPSQTDNIEGHVNTFSGPVWVKAVDKRGNAVSNKLVTFSAGQPQSLWVPPLDVDVSARLYEKQSDCAGVATQTGCDANLYDSIEKHTDSSGAWVGVVLGNTDNTRYPITATGKKDLGGKEIPTAITTTFSHTSYPVSGRESGVNRSYLAALGLQHVDENGKRIDAGLAGVPMATPLETLLFVNEEVDRSIGAFVTRQITSGQVVYNPYAGGGTPIPLTVTAPTNGAFATTITPGPVAALNRVAAQATATVTLQSGETKTLTDTTYFRIWGVKPDVVPNQQIYINGYGYPEADVKLTFTISPADYAAYSKYLVIYEDEVEMGFVPAGDGYALLSQGGAKFDIRKKYGAQLVLNGGSKQEIRSAVVPLNVTMLCLVPDYDHNRKIDYADRARALKGDTYYFWVNDDDGHGDTEGTGIPGSGNNGFLATVNGTRDLVDFFPVQLDIKDVLGKLDPGQYRYALRTANERLKFVYTDLVPSQSGNYLTDVPTAQRYANAATVDVTALDGLTSRTAIDFNKLDSAFLAGIKNSGTGIILVEGNGRTTSPLILGVYDQAGREVFNTSLNLRIDGVEQMFRHKSLVQDGGGPPPNTLLNYGAVDQLLEPVNFPDSETNDKHFVFVHGYNVNGEQARGWNAEMFKRMYWSGSRAKFWGVTWYGWDTQDLSIVTLPFTRNFHINVQHALKTAPAFSDFINLPVGGKNVTVAAHSLGNMLVSSAIVEQDAKVDNYFLIDAAVPVEAYDGTVGKPAELSKPIDSSMNQMVVWNGYKAGYLASEWYRYFDSSDERSKLTWRGRFASVKDNTKAYNFYSSGEDVLDNHAGTPTIPDIFTEGTGRFAWGLQEKLKGGLPTGWMLGSNYGGWRFDRDTYHEWIIDAAGQTVEVALTPDSANQLALTPDDIQSKPFFELTGDDLTLLQPYPAGSDYAKANRDRLLAEAIPALSLAVGKNEVSRFDDIQPKVKRNIDMNLSYKNGWPPSRSQKEEDKQWKHSDLRDVGFPYIYSVYDKLKSLMELVK
jgi:transglutaminase superfamily protein